MAIWGCGSPARFCQPAVAGGFIYAVLRSELNIHLAPIGFVYSEFCVQCHCYKLSPFQAHWGRWHCTRFLRPVCLFTVPMGSGSYPLLCGVFLPPPVLQAFPLLVTGLVPQLLPSPAGLLWGISPPPLFGAQGAPPSLLRVFFFCYCLLFRFFSLLFPWVGVILSRGLCSSGPGLSVGVPRTT
jgi:hypothetical protein